MKKNAKKITKKAAPKKEEPVEVEEVDILAEEEMDFDEKDALMAELRASFKSADKEQKAKVKEQLSEYGLTKLDDTLTIEQLNEIKLILE